MIKTGIKSLIDKFRKILVARMRGQTEQARTLFNGINIEDFPIIPEFRMSHGLNGDAETALFFIDHDWDDHGGNDPNWCNLFIADVIEALETS
jgi:hypothetical protein